MTLLPIIDSSSPGNALHPEPVELPEGMPVRGTYAFVSLGCPKNLVDSEKMLGQLAGSGYLLVDDPCEADFIIINTCGFIDASREESRSVIQEMLDLKAAGRTGGVIVAGCLPERLEEEGGLLREMPDIDHVVGVFGRDEIVQVADRMTEGVREQREVFRPAPVRAADDRARLRITPSHYAYLKISEGCSRTCTFCSIPRMRGKHVTKPIEMVLDEARELAADGVRELILVAQDTTWYGLDLYGEVRLARLLRELDGVDGIDWIRLMYLYPAHFTDELMATIADSAKILPYLDIPLQHISTAVLKRMQRRVTGPETRELIARLRDRIENLVLRTTFITGFPGETDAQFQELCDFVAEARFERMGVFSYSPEPGTPAMRLDGHLPEHVRSERRDTLMALQQPVAFAHAESLVGCELDVLIDSPADVSGDRPAWIGRSFIDAPEIDACTFVVGGDLRPGQMVPVEILRRQDYDLIGVVSDADDTD